MPRRITRVADLCKVFEGGASPLMNEVATVCILYEDFRYELANLKRAIEAASVGKDQEPYYWIRRSLLTMNEFGKRLNSLLTNQAHEKAFDALRKDQRDALTAARRAINRSSLETLRNYFGGHLDPDLIGNGLKFYGSDAFSKMTWTDSRDELQLSLDFAYDIFRGAFAGHFAPTVDKLQDKLQAFYVDMGELFGHIAIATFILVHEFVWVKFG